MNKKVFLMLIGTLLLILSSGCSKQIFSGSVTANDNQFIMSYSILNKTETREMNLKEGTKIDVNIENESGRLDIFVEDSQGNKIYTGNGASVENFKLIITKTDTYKFSVTGKKAKGGVSFKVVD